MRTFAATAAAGLALAAATVYHEDPGGRFGRAAYRFDRNWEDSRLLTYPFEPDERALRAAQLKIIERPDLVLLGSSRMMPVSSAMFRPGLKLFNAGMSGAVVKDYAALWQGLVEAQKTPPRLIIYADPWILNKNSGQFRWRANRALYDRFRRRTAGGPGARLLARMSSFWVWLCRLDAGLDELLNGPVLLAAGRDLWSGRARGAGPRLITEDEHLPGKPGWRPDGSVSFAWSGHTLAEIRKIALRFAGETEVFALGRYEADPSEAGLLDDLLADASRAGTKVLLIVLPYHKAALRRLSERPQYRGVIADHVARLKGLPGYNARFSLCEAQDPEASGCSELEFEDGMHPLESCHRKILRGCLAQERWAGLAALEAPRPVAAPRPAPRTAKLAPAPASHPARVLPRRAGVEWVLIPGGSYMMGAPDLGAEPVHPVKIKTFEMARTLVTVAQYRACVGAGRCTQPSTGPDCNWGRSGREDHPVNCVDWAQARTFSEWIGGRLPSESEWEYAARSRGKTQMYPWGEEPATCERAVMRDGGEGCGPDATAPVCSKPKGNSEQGLCDMAGNVREWVQDTYHFSYEGAPDDGSAWQSLERFRIMRGGSSSCTTENARVDVRSSYLAEYRDYGLGFRPAR